MILHDFIASSADDSFFMNGRCIKVGCVGVHFVEFSERPQGSWILSRRTWYSSHKFALRAKLVPVIMCEKSKSTTFSYYKMILIREGRSIYHLKHQAAKSLEVWDKIFGSNIRPCDVRYTNILKAGVAGVQTPQTSRIRRLFCF